MNDGIAVAEAALVDRFGPLPGELPEPDPDKAWLRVNPSPCCRSADSAAINYKICWFLCHRCGKDATVSYGSWWEGRVMIGGIQMIRVYATQHHVSRHRRQIDAAAHKAARAWPFLLGRMERDDLVAYARWRVCVYAGLMPQDEVDWGRGDWDQLAEWETQCKADPDQLDRYVSHALNRDLTDMAVRLYRKHTVKRGERDDGQERRVSRETSLELLTHDDEGGHKRDRLEFEGRSTAPAAEEQARFVEVPWGPNYPVTTMVFCLDLAVSEVASLLRISTTRAYERLHEEMDELKPLLDRQR